MGPGNRDISVERAITICSSDPSNTIIDCQGSASSPHRAFAFNPSGSGATVAAGLTIANGYGPLESFSGRHYASGGGIYITNGTRCL